MSGVQTSHKESTADQIVQPVYKDALSQWRGNIPQVKTSFNPFPWGGGVRDS